MKIICKIFGHKFMYYIKGSSDYRCCRICGDMQELRFNVPAYGTGWFSLVSRTKNGAKNFLESVSLREKKLKFQNKLDKIHK